jgi:hypothetical protein
MVRECRTNGSKRNACRILVGKPEGKRQLGRPRCRYADDIKMDLREIGWGIMDWIDLAQDRDQWRPLVKTVLNFGDSQNIWKFLSSFTAGSLSRRTQLHEVS